MMIDIPPLKIKLTKDSVNGLGFHFAKGAINYLGRIFLIGLVVAIIFSFALPTDNSDRGRGHRSGLTIHVDAATGVSYVSDGNGGMCVRINLNGTPYTNQDELEK